MMTMIEKHRQFRIYEVDDGYIVRNMNMADFAHSHIRNLKSARWVCELSLKKKLPHDMPVYLMISLLRVNDDEKYCEKIKELIDSKGNRKDMYFNSNKGVRKK